jgi:hypothetical protein
MIRHLDLVTLVIQDVAKGFLSLWGFAEEKSI